jgi:hypothetical protein
MSEVSRSSFAAGENHAPRNVRPERNPRIRLRTGVVFVDEVVTRVTGKALPEQRTILDLGGAGWWSVSVAALIAAWSALIFSVWSVPTAGQVNVLLVPVILVALIVVVGRLRAQQVVFGHHAVHGTISKRRPWLNTVVKHFATIVPLAQNPAEYRSDHVKKHHKWRFFTTVEDPDAAFLLELGFVPGKTRSELYRTLWKTVLSPRFHGLFLRARIHSALISADSLHRWLVLAWIAILMLIAALIPWWAFLIAVLLPLGPLYHVSALLQFLTEHRWLVSADGPRDKHDYATRCVGRFCLVPAPERSLAWPTALMRWTFWLVRMVPEVLVRLGVLVGDLPAHDHHHLVAHVGHDPHDWDEALFERQRSIDGGDPSSLGCRETYGLAAALDWVFEGLSSSKS